MVFQILQIILIFTQLAVGIINNQFQSIEYCGKHSALSLDIVGAFLLVFSLLSFYTTWRSSFARFCYHFSRPTLAKLFSVINLKNVYHASSN